MTEYVIQKRGLAVWQYVTWYSDKEQALENFRKLQAGQGYSYRLVELQVIEQSLLEGEREDIPPSVEAVEAVKSSGWSVPSSDWGTPAPKTSNSEHGMVGKVWLGNPVTKEKKRVEPSLVDAMMKDGWIKAGPRTVL